MTSPKDWRFVFTVRSERHFNKLPKNIKQRVVDFFEKRVLASGEPYSFGKALTGRLSGYWGIAWVIIG